MQKSKRIATNNSTNNDTNINGANITADNIIINSGNDLNVASLQNTSNSSSKSKSIGAGGGKSSASLSYNSSKSEFSRNWVDDQTDIIANNNITINTANNTDLKGALINSETDNLTINTATLTYSDIIDTEIQESSSFGISTNISVGQYSKNPDASNPNQDKSYYPDGSTTLSMANNGYEKEQITRATIGSGIINITNNNNNQTQDITSLNRDINKNQEITKDTITGALNVQTTIDNRIIGAIIGNEGAQDSLVKTITGAASNFKKTLNQLLRADKIVLNAGIIVSDMIGANNMKDSFQHQNNINDAYVNAAFESISDNFSGNTENSSFTGILKTNKGIVDSIESTQKDPELTIGLNSLTSLTPKEIIDILQQAADNNDQYSNNDTHDGQIILYQDNNNITGTYAFAYDNTDDKNRIDNNDPIIKTINLNLAGIDITNSGEVINAIYHEGTNFKTHTNNEQEAHRGGSFAQDLWESNSIVNNYQNLNQITANQYNQIYNSSNNQDIAIGNEVSYVQHVYDNENVNDYLYLMDRKIPFTEWARTKDVEDFDLNFGVQGVVTRVYASFGTDGFSVGADLNPSVGIGVYSNIVPRGENVEYSVVFGFKNSLTGSAGTIITDKGNFGITGSYGLSIPFYPIPTNVSRTIPLDKLKQDSK